MTFKSYRYFTHVSFHSRWKLWMEQIKQHLKEELPTAEEVISMASAIGIWLPDEFIASFLQTGEYGTGEKSRFRPFIDDALGNISNAPLEELLQLLYVCKLGYHFNSIEYQVSKTNKHSERQAIVMRNIRQMVDVLRMGEEVNNQVAKALIPLLQHYLRYITYFFNEYIVTEDMGVSLSMQGTFSYSYGIQNEWLLEKIKQKKDIPHNTPINEITNAISQSNSINDSNKKRELITVKEAARRVNCSVQRIYQHIQNKILSVVKNDPHRGMLLDAADIEKISKNQFITAPTGQKIKRRIHSNKKREER